MSPAPAEKQEKKGNYSMAIGSSSHIANAATQSVSTPAASAGSTGAGPAREKDRTESSTAPQFGEVMKQMQARYGAKAEKPREIKKTLGKDDFLKIMITQMRNQDPTNPFKAEQMATEMAQFTSVEQLQNVNQNLAKLTQAGQPLERMAMTNLIGKQVLIDRERFPHQERQNESLAFSLPQDAKEMKIAIISDAGETILEKDLGPQKKGEGSFTWDGLKGNTLPAKSGNYMLRIEARNENGQAIQTNSQAQARVIGVSFEGNEPYFLVGDAKHQEKVTMKNIVRIETDFGQPGMTQIQAPAAQAAGSPGIRPVSAGQGGPNFIAFEKGVGSSNLDAASATPEIREALAKAQAALAAETAGSAAPAAKPAGMAQYQAQAVAPQGERGFPNGLQDEDDKPSDSKPSETHMKGGDKK